MRNPDKEQDEGTAIYICRRLDADGNPQNLPEVQEEDLPQDLANSQLYHDMEACVEEDTTVMYDAVTVHDPKGGMAEEVGLVANVGALQIWYRDRERMICEFAWRKIQEVETSHAEADHEGGLSAVQNHASTTIQIKIQVLITWCT